MILPLDPDYGGGGAAPLIGGRLSYDRRGLPEFIELLRDDTPGAPGVVMTDPAIQEVISELNYSRDGLVNSVTYGDARDDTGAARTPTVSTMTYDVRRRPITMETVRTPTGTGTMLDPRPLSAVTIPFSQLLTWDRADNLTAITDLRDGAEWPDGYRPQHTTVEHDALYRVTRADYAYTVDAAPYADTDAPSNWRTEALLSRPNDPMGSRPAPMIDELPSSRPMHMTWEYDWLGNAEMWNDDANQFYERSIGDITNGADLTGVDRPGAIRIAHNLVPAAVGADHGGWLEVEYGLDGNVSVMTVHANCRDDNDDTNGDAGLEVCQPHPTPTASYGSRVTYLRDRCICAQEQHYNYRWDELNRIAEAMRFDRTGGSGTWTPMVRQRYLYDSANERTVKQTLDLDVMSSTPEAVALYVYPGDFERRGLVRNAGGTSYTALPGAETQYVVGGARLVWRTPTRNPAIGIDRDQRLTIGLSDLIQSTSATLDLLTGELVETSNYYANGARESYRASTNGDRVAPEPMGFTGKEADEEVGLTYFGQRYLMSHLGRWASPDPLQTHAVGGGEALNGYHYVAGNVLQARDPTGLEIVVENERDRAAVLSTLQLFTNHELAYDGNRIVETGRLVNEGRDLVHGTSLISSLIGDEHVVAITIFNGSSVTEPRDENGSRRPGVGSDVHVYWNPDEAGDFIASEGFGVYAAREMSEDFGMPLIHELIHADHFFDGENRPREIVEVYERTAGGDVILANYYYEEARTVGLVYRDLRSGILVAPAGYEITENSIRGEQGMPSRESYSHATGAGSIGEAVREGPPRGGVRSDPTSEEPRSHRPPAPESH